MTQPEIGVAEVSIALDVMKRLPDHRLLLQEALIRHQQVQVPLREETTALAAPPCVWSRYCIVCNPTLCLIMVLKWLFLKNTEISPSLAVALSSHRP